MITMIVFVTRKAGLSPAEFSAYWLENHAPLVKSVPEFMRHIRKYVQHHPAPGAGAAAPVGNDGAYDGVGEIWFDSRAAMTTAFTEPRYLEIIRPDEARFFDATRCLSFISTEHVMFDALDGHQVV